MRGFGLGDPAFLAAISQPASTLLLDLFPGAACAYSLNQLRTGVTNVVRVRRASDNTLQDFTAAQVFNGTLTAFTGAGDGFVHTWYDQTSNGRNAVQADTSLQPQIVANGALIAGGIDFVASGGLNRLVLPQPFSGTSGRALFVAANNTNPSLVALFALAIGPVTTLGSVWNANATPSVTLSGNKIWTSGAMTTPSIGSFHLPANGVINDHTFWRNGSEVTGFTSANGTAAVNTIAVANACIGTNNLENTRFSGTMRELILYPSDQLANRAGITANMNARLSIY